MIRVLQRIGQGAFALFVAGALAFGASEVLAGVPALDCPDNGMSQLGECSGPDPEGDCQARCELAGGTLGVCEEIGEDVCCGCLH